MNYILQKDLPDFKAGEPYAKDGSGFYSSKNRNDAGMYSVFVEKFVENNPEWFLPEVKRRKVGYYWTKYGGTWYIRYFNKDEWSHFGNDIKLKDSDFDEIDETPIVRKPKEELKSLSEIFNDESLKEFMDYFGNIIKRDNK